MRRTSLLPFAFALALPSSSEAQDAKDLVMQHVVAHAEEHAAVAMQIWDLAELGYLEHESSSLLQARLADAGFEVTAGVGGLPTAFVASYGSGSPVIGVLAEFDALPGISQDRVPELSAIAGKPNGHACGHHLFAAGSTAAALAVKDWLESSGQPGTIRLIGTPAEEGGGGKIYMARAGVFDDIDAVLTWHPSDANDASSNSTLANISAKFRFSGVSSHAARAPERGRSALDGVEAMNYMVNMLREHIPQESRLHYVITNGGLAPTVVPNAAESFHYVRHPDATTVREIFERLVATAEGAALGTGTTMEYEIINGVYNVLPNTTLGRLLHENLEVVGGVEYNEEERRFAELLQRTLPANSPPLSSAAEIQPFEEDPPVGTASTDVGDVSWVVPTVSLGAATYVPGGVSHTWQAVAAGGTSIGTKGMLVAAKTIARTAVDLFMQPQVLVEARAEFDRRRGGGEYVPFVGDRDPPLDYRRVGGS